MSESDPSSRGAYARAVQFCRARKLFRRGDRVLVGSASGVASIAALGFLSLAQRDLGIAELAVAAVDAGGEQDADAVADAGRFARHVGASFYALSSEGRGTTRALRELGAREGFQRIGLGHTRDDAVARVLAQILGGRGVLHLRPYVARRRDGIVRPLLVLRESESVELARAAGLEPVSLPPGEEGRLPLELRLRRAVLPRLRVEVPDADRALLHAGVQIRQLVHAMEREGDRLCGEGPQAGSRLELPLVGSPVLAHAVARAALKRLGRTATRERGVRDALALLLLSTRPENETRETVLGSGLVASYVPERRVVALRVKAPARNPDSGIG